MNGTVKFFNQMKGFGFIAGEDNKEYFVHQSDIQDGVTINDDDSVTFDVTEGDRGPKAVNVGKGAAEPAEEAEVAEETVEEEATEKVVEDEAAEEVVEDKAAEEPVEKETEE